MSKAAYLLVLFCYALSVNSQTFTHALKADYYNGINFNYFVRSKTEKSIGFWRELRSPAKGVNEEYFSIRYTGSLKPPKTGLYHFHIVADDGVRLWINHELLVDAWVEQEATAYIATIFLESGQAYDFKVEYYNSVVHSILSVKWQVPQDKYDIFEKYKEQTFVDIPSTALNTVPAGIQSRSSITSLMAKQKAPASARVALVLISEKPKKLSIPAVSVSENQPVVLKTLLFDQQSAVIKKNSHDELDELSKYLHANPKKIIHITGHTDYIGDSVDNQILSESRAKAVARYLIEKGIQADRITSDGMGSRHPLIRSTSLEERHANRRVEFTLTDQ